MKKLMTHIVAGYPTMKLCEEVALKMVECGVDFVEIQIPFSDPVADGMVIRKANEEALKSGVKVEDCFKLMGRLQLRAATLKAKTRFLFMSYFNILHSYGVERFCERAREVGCYGLIVPDVPYDEERQANYLKNCREYGLKAIQVISPLTPAERLRRIGRVASGFVYCVARYGTTGVGEAVGDLDFRLKIYLKKIRRYVKSPLAVGFGISSKKQVRAVWKEAEIAVIGSKIIDLIPTLSPKKIMLIFKSMPGAA